MGYTRFPLTPALSSRERENGPPPLDHTRAGVCPITTGKTPNRCALFPAHEPYSQVVGNERMLENRFMGARRDQSSGRSLPEGEGQGKRRERPSRVSDHSRNCEAGRVLRQNRRFPG